MSDFFQTKMGHEFFEGRVPAMLKQMQQLNENLVALTDAVQNSGATRIEHCVPETKCFLLLNVVDRKIFINRFDTLESAQSAMRRSVNQYDTSSATEFMFYDMEAALTAGVSLIDNKPHDSDWLIVEV